MSAERKKAEKKEIPKVEPKKRAEPKVVPKVEPKPKVVGKVETKKVTESVTNEPTEAKAKRSENKYVRIAFDAKAEEKKEISEKVQKGELKLACYAIDGDKGYHYYLVIKK